MVAIIAEMLYECAQRGDDLGVLGEAALALLREHERAVTEDVELTLGALDRGRVMTASS
jgi:hypothetical protein